MSLVTFYVEGTRTLPGLLSTRKRHALDADLSRVPILQHIEVGVEGATFDDVVIPRLIHRGSKQNVVADGLMAPSVRV